MESMYGEEEDERGEEATGPPCPPNMVMVYTEFRFMIVVNKTYRFCCC